MAMEWPPVDLIADLSLNPNANIEKVLDENVLASKHTVNKLQLRRYSSLFHCFDWDHAVPFSLAKQRSYMRRRSSCIDCLDCRSNPDM